MASTGSRIGGNMNSTYWNYRTETIDGEATKEEVEDLQN